ncbi:MAG TPA: hypothetical protein VKU82_00045 [Planctomycetaceae bacterium]|nr:hypothetical protein [Planctomycetaceae bacterium]
MSRSLKALSLVAAMSLGAVFSFMLIGSADDKRHEESPAARSGESPPEKPRSRSGPRAPDLPIQHAILQEERAESAAEEKIVRSLDKPTTVDFNELPLEEALVFLKEYHNINIWIDRASLLDEGIALLQQPITLTLAGVRFESVLNLLLQPSHLDWVIQDEVMKITTEGWAAQHPEVRTYDVHNLIDAGHAPQDLTAAITQSIEPRSWGGKDGVASISHTGGVLIIRQSQRVHSEIAHLLADLDDIAKAGEDEQADLEKKAVVSIKVYPIGAEVANDLADCLQQFVAADSWENAGGQGKIRALSGMLVVEQTADVHTAIQRFLGELTTESPQSASCVSTQPRSETR